MDRISTEEVRSQPPLTHIIRTTRLKFFSHIARADPSMDHSGALRSSTALCQGTGTADQADLVKLGSAQLNLMLLHSTLVWQLPIIEHKFDRHGGCLWEWTSHVMMMMMIMMHAGDVSFSQPTASKHLNPNQGNHPPATNFLKSLLSADETSHYIYNGSVTTIYMLINNIITACLMAINPGQHG